ncbi:MAG: hypothetical protein IPJ04_13160 [Candidatus Eisenbacteria bacterium]|nr:hypothetical protein [Candidatus Eisenbacteria bacterium]
MNPHSLLFALALSVTTANVPTLPPADLHPGQPAVVRTVFAGDSIETFDAVILGVMDGGRSDGKIILARATSERVVASGVAQGMSGSPVYVNGKLIGALSSGWPFSKEPIFGITPIGEMLDVLDRPDAPPGDAAGGPSGLDEPGARSWREFAWPDDSARPRPARSTRRGPCRSGCRSPRAACTRRLSAPCASCSTLRASRSRPAGGWPPRARRARTVRSRARSCRAAPSRWTCCAATSTSRRSAP